MLTFDLVRHAYEYDGIPVPGVTKTLQGVGLINFDHVPPERLEAALKFGSNAHLATELHDRGVLNDTKLDPALRPYLDAWIKFKKDTLLVIEEGGIEEKVFSKRYWYAGTMDRRVMLHGRRTVVDISTSVDFSPAKALQVAAYKEAYNEGKPIIDKIKDRVVVRLTDKGKYILPPEKYYGKNDFTVFMSCLTLNNWRMTHGKSN